MTNDACNSDDWRAGWHAGMAAAVEECRRIARFGRLGDELAGLRLTLSRDDVDVDSGRGANVLDGPLTALRLWLEAMARHTPRWSVRAGDVVTTGTITDAWPMAPGQVWRSRPDHAALHGLTLRTAP